MSKRKPTSAKPSKRTEPTLATISLAPIPLSTLLQPIYLIAVCAVMMLFGALALRLMVDIDIGFHLHGGEWIWQHRAFPDKDAYTYTVPNNATSICTGFTNCSSLASTRCRDLKD